MSFDDTIRNIMSGHARGAGPTLARAGLSILEPGYAGIVSLRNVLFDRAWLAVRRLPRPVISVGNLTTGGTGKTPAVQWLVSRLRSEGRRPAVLMRGYRRRAAKGRPAAPASDEEQLLRESLACPVIANPDRHAGGLQALRDDPAIDVFVLDDGFQHRRLARDVDLVLVDATNPFGYGHVLPRGMLRERPTALRRAHAVLLTRTDLVETAALAAIEHAIRSIDATLPIVHTTHAPDAVRGQVKADSLRDLAGRPIYAFCGIGNPSAFETALARAGLRLAGTRRFADHHAYSAADVASIAAAARGANAALVLTTAKDWVKVRPLLDGRPIDPPFAQVLLRLGISSSAQAQAMRAIVDRLGDGRTD